MQFLTNQNWKGVKVLYIFMKQNVKKRYKFQNKSLTFHNIPSLKNFWCLRNDFVRKLCSIDKKNIDRR